VHELLAESRTDSGWRQQPYFAVTVPEHYGYDPYFSLQGLVYGVNRDTLHARVDVPATADNLHRVFRFRGLFHPDGSWDASVYKDENASTLSRNYASAYVQLGIAYREQGRLDDAIRELGYAARMFPDLTEVQLMLAGFHVEKGDTARALAIYRALVKLRPSDPEARNYYGVALWYQNDVAGALREFDEAIRLDPTYTRSYYSAYTLLLRAGQNERALTYLQRLLNEAPDDAQARAILQAARPGGAALPRTALPPPALYQP
jgi:tetratricopeptide (TPR) repeat protein